MKKGKFISNQIGRGVRMKADETPDTHDATIYEQRWAMDNMVKRVFRVLAADDKSARVMGSIRIQDRYKSDPIAWTLEHVRKIERTQAGLWAVLTEETKAEKDYRLDRYMENK